MNTRSLITVRKDHSGASVYQNGRKLSNMELYAFFDGSYSQSQPSIPTEDRFINSIIGDALVISRFDSTSLNSFSLRSIYEERGLL